MPRNAVFHGFSAPNLILPAASLPQMHLLGSAAALLVLLLPGCLLAAARAGRGGLRRDTVVKHKGRC